ncbi:MAG: histidine triad nucleotide-binding protein, partial [Chloroflexi bacterium]|nr:histidine triad nucleotide-binding protein [Chloroflexota bacterium]
SGSRDGDAPAGYRLVLTQGDDSGQAIVHPHMHLPGGKKLGALG